LAVTASIVKLPSFSYWSGDDVAKLISSFQIAVVAEYIRHPSSKRIDAGENPVDSAIAK
jgi:hypothetical protein